MYVHTDLNKSLNTLFDTGLSFARFGFSVAGAAVNYASEILKDVSIELKTASERVAPYVQGAEPPVVEAEAKPAE
ncbi:MAG: hypothetical protein HY906_12855 [Deltaproteobacteria bacterium]|nr:hypothetical protein [Deltaproteobacteria bacterium]